MSSNTALDKQRLLVAAARRLESLNRSQSFDPFNPDSLPTEKQSEVIADFGRIKQQWIRAGNQCKPHYSQVLMADGSYRAIGDIEEGEYVMAFDYATQAGVPARVLRKWNNGVKSVHRYWYGSQLFTDATPNHEMPYHNGSNFNKRPIGNSREVIRYFHRDKLDRSWATARIRRSEYLGEMDVYDITIDHPDHVYICDGLATGNSGKSQVCARLLTWVLTDTHPSWIRPSEWLQEPLLAIVAGRTGKQIEESLLPKIRSYLEPGSYKEVRIGNIIQRLELSNGNRIVFQSLENPNVARERLQSYVAHIAWVDELPPTLEIVREILVRTQARNGYNLFSFTPTIVSIEIQNYVDTLLSPEGKVYRFRMLDNPLYSDPTRRAELIARYAHLPDHQRNAVLEGDWMQSDSQVYYFNYSKHVSMPENYSRLWRHVESVDPALKSALGLTVWAESPTTKRWYCILAEYVKGIQVPTELVAAVREKTKEFNIVRRVADPHEVWYIQTAASMGIHYIGVYKKNERKGELIKQLQENLGGQMLISPNCPDLISELQECRYSDQASGRIINASSYHLLDSAQYFADNKPKPESTVIAHSWDEWLYKKNDERKLGIEKQKMRLQKQLIRRTTSRRAVARNPKWNS